MAAGIDEIKKEMGTWEVKLQELRVKANLSKMEVRDLVNKAEVKFRAVRDGIANAAERGAAQADSTVAGVKAAWASFKDAYNAAIDKHRNS
ncbi:MAG TPA: hypothetical protein VFY93_17105 [Planctomycetota bacterium]|nr:hypothetical protein [Planctomycetota bacterium]